METIWKNQFPKEMETIWKNQFLKEMEKLEEPIS